jgi:hypothetical protein
MIIKSGSYVILCIANYLVADLAHGQTNGAIIGYNYNNSMNQHVCIKELLQLARKPHT